MLARITIVNNPKLNPEEFKKLSDFLCDEVSHTKLIQYYDESSNTTVHREFYSWNHTLDPNDDSGKKLVKQSDLVSIDDGKEYFADVSSFLTEFPTLKINIRGMINSFSNDKTLNKTLELINQMKEIQEKFQSALKSFNEKIEFNAKCDVHVANLGLLNINQLGYITDTCTEKLQELLNDGWRIIACCVQPDQRRPDYILGRYNPIGKNVECVNF